jgi:beta-aspartyl-peptidase (threonine type)
MFKEETRMLLAIHGGAGDKKPTAEQFEIMRKALRAGLRIMKDGGDALSAVVEAITILEDSAIFNAGAGGVLQLDGTRRLDASVMEGAELKAGSVIGIEGIRNPIRAAQLILDTPHVMMTNRGAKQIARAHQLTTLESPSPQEMEQLDRIKKADTEIVRLYKKYFSTVGAVARDSERNLAAGASTGGIRTMLPGRVGDTPVIGSGTYADNSLAAVSCTGNGEQIIRLGLAKEICMNSLDESLRRAASQSLKRIRMIGGNAGVICLAGRGGAVILHTTKYMASGYVTKRKLQLFSRSPR